MGIGYTGGRSLAQLRQPCREPPLAGPTKFDGVETEPLGVLPLVDHGRMGHALTTSRDVVELARAGNPDAVRTVAEAGRAIGSVLSTAASLLNPEVIVIGGDIAHAHEPLIGGVRETLLRMTQPLATANLVVTHSRLGDHAGIFGGALAIRDTIFSVEAVDEQLQRTGLATPAPESA